MLPSYLRLQLEQVIFLTFLAAIFLLHTSLGFDYYWHLKTGEVIYQTGGLPTGDIFSFTANGKWWVLHEWLFEVVLYFVHAHTGVYGVKLFSALIMTLSVYVVYRAARRLNADDAVLLFVVAIVFLIIQRFNFPRPQLITFLFLALYLYALVGYRYHNIKTGLYWLPPIMLVWVNMHGGYVIGIALLVLYVTSDLFDRMLSINKRGEETPLRPVLYVLLLSICVSLVNPYTYHHWVYPFQVMSLSLTDVITEWKSPDFHLLLSKLYLLYMFSFLFLCIYSEGRPRLVEVVVPLFFIAMSFISRRHMPVALLVTLPFYALALKRFSMQLRRTDWGEKVFSLKIAGQYVMNGSVELGVKGYLFNWFLLVVVIVGTYHLHQTEVHRIASYESDAQPVDAVDFIKKAGIQGNVLNAYNNGGYLIYSLYPDSKVFIDGRADLYGDQLFSEYQIIKTGAEGWEEVIEKYEIDYVIFDTKTTLVGSLDRSNEFKLIYRDRRFSVYLRDNEKFRTIIDYYQSIYVGG
ncbi:MAG: hypothetical protein ABFS08_00415 [Pseudomonadota bacterium]